MPNKTFADFTTIPNINQPNHLQTSDYLIGYRPGYSNQEIKITTYDFANSLGEVLDVGTIGSELIEFQGISTKNNITVQDKLRQFSEVSDFSDQATAAANSYDKRLFIPRGTEVIINLTNSSNANLNLYNILTKIGNWHIEGSVRIVLSHGTWNVYTTVNLNHPYGQNIQIIGDLNAPDLVIIQMNGTTANPYDIFKCSNGCTFGLIDGVTINGIGNASAPYAGVASYAGALINLGYKVVVKGCVNGVKADNGGSVIADGVTVQSGVDQSHTMGNGFYAVNRSYISALSAVGTYNINSYKAENNSQILATNSSGRYNSQNGYYAGSNSHIAASGAIASYNTKSGFYAQNNGSIECYNAVAASNGSYGIEFNNGGIVNGSSNLLTSTYTSLSTYRGNAAVTSSTGSLVLRTPDINSILFNTNNYINPQFEVANSSNPVSHVTVTGGDINGHSTISVSNAGLSNDPIGLKIYPGVDTKYIDLGKRIRFGTFTPQSLTLKDVSAAGYITCQDVNGTQCRLLVLSTGA